MAVNTLNAPKPKTKTNRSVKGTAKAAPRPKGLSIFKLLERLLNVDSFFEHGLPVKYLPKTLFVSFLIIFYIGNTHYAEKTIRRIDKTKTETEDLRADYTTLKSEYMFASKQSEVADGVAPLGLIESSTPPIQIFKQNPEDER